MNISGTDSSSHEFNEAQYNLTTMTEAAPEIFRIFGVLYQEWAWGLGQHDRGGCEAE
jgi:hypothetical protein